MVGWLLIRVVPELQAPQPFPGRFERANRYLYFSFRKYAFISASSWPNRPPIAPVKVATITP